MNHITKIPFSKKRTFYAFLGVGAVLGVIVYYQNQIIRFVLETNSIKALIFSSIIFLILLGFFLFIVYRLLKPPMDLVLDETGFSDESSFGDIGKVEWQDIVEIKKIKDLYQDVLLVFLANPNKYISRETNKLQLKLLEKNRKYYGTFLLINPNLFRFDANELISLINIYHKRHKSNK